MSYTESYADIETRADARVFITDMVDALAGVADADAVRKSIRRAALEEHERTELSTGRDDAARSLGASLVILELNVIDGTAK